MSRFRDCFDAIHAALVAEQEHRRQHPDTWVERERLAVVDAANLWSSRHGGVAVTVSDVEHVEPLAVGHIDYSKKLSLYVAEIVCGERVAARAARTQENSNE